MKNHFEYLPSGRGKYVCVVGGYYYYCYLMAIIVVITIIVVTVIVVAIRDVVAKIIIMWV